MGAIDYTRNIIWFSIKPSFTSVAWLSSARVLRWMINFYERA